MEFHGTVIIYMRMVVVFQCMNLNTRVISEEDFGGFNKENKVKSS